MTLNLVNYKKRTRQAVEVFWKNRKAATESQLAKGKTSEGSRGAVLAGKNLDGFLELFKAVVVGNGLKEAEFGFTRKLMTLPGYFRPTKRWDFVVSYKDELVALIELKSQVGSFGNNFNNRCEEALGNATDFWTAYREGAFGSISQPFLGYLMIVEDCEASRKIGGLEPSLFDPFPEFKDTSYIDRYSLFARKLVSENLYSAASIVTTPTNSINGGYSEISDDTGMGRFIAGFAGRIATAAAEI